MKIIYLHQYFNTPEMSGGTRSYEMARRMVEAGHEVHVITSSRNSKSVVNDWVISNEAGINVHWYPVPYSNKMTYFQRMKAFFSFALSASFRSASLKGDVVFATSTPLTIAIPGVFSARKNKIPLVFEVRDLWPEMPIAIGALNNSFLRYLARRLERWAYRNSSAVVALSPGMKDGVVRSGYPINKVAVIPNGSDNSEFELDHIAAAKFRSERAWLGSRPLLIYAGTFGKVNDVNYMVDLAVELKKIKSNIRILLIGDGSEKTSVIHNAKLSQVFEDNLFFENSVPKKNIPILFSAATMASNLVIDIPEARANSANKFFDTLASGKPVFLNHGGWMHDVVNYHGCGYSSWNVPLPDVAKNLDDILNDQEWLDKAGSKSKVMAESYFDRDILAKNLIDSITLAVADRSEEVEDLAPGVYLK